ncbi:MAG: GNAT family N-acetyltransferase [Pseudomonadota bacterium]
MFDLNGRGLATPVSLEPPPWRYTPVSPGGHISPKTHEDDAMPETITIEREDTGSKARYVASVAGVDGQGELTLSKVSDVLVIVDHTQVDDSLRGMGVAGALAKRVIADARQAGQRIVPLCPFLRSYALKHREEVSDVVQW